MADEQMAASQRQALAGLSDASRTMSETSDMIMDGWAARSSAMDRMGDNFSQAIRGVDTYVDSYGDQIAHRRASRCPFCRSLSGHRRARYDSKEWLGYTALVQRPGRLTAITRNTRRKSAQALDVR